LFTSSTLFLIRRYIVCDCRYSVHNDDGDILNFQALDGALKIVKTASPETAAMFFSSDADTNKAVVLAASPKVRYFCQLECWQFFDFDIRHVLFCYFLLFSCVTEFD
jgi:hypothetical protein